MKVDDLTKEKKETCGHSVRENSFSQDEIFKENGEETESPLLAESFWASAVKNSYTVFSQLSWGLPPCVPIHQKKERKSALHQNEADETSEKNTFVNLNEGWLEASTLHTCGTTTDIIICTAEPRVTPRILETTSYAPLLRELPES